MQSPEQAEEAVRRHVRVVSEEPVVENGKARLYGYGFRAIAGTAGCFEKTVRRAAKSGKLDPQSLGSVVKWVSRRTPATKAEGSK